MTADNKTFDIAHAAREHQAGPQAMTLSNATAVHGSVFLCIVIWLPHVCAVTDAQPPEAIVDDLMALRDSASSASSL